MRRKKMHVLKHGSNVWPLTTTSVSMYSAMRPRVRFMKDRKEEIQKKQQQILLKHHSEYAFKVNFNIGQ